ncbi:MAG: Gfo/Idh/MocA family oxidoreductase [Armatimonadetes bacterium]|nr:Gfo/Idh/MocA family oxidoreductase [Armatimonadota bacterium]
MAETVRLGFVGCGKMGQQAHLANYVGLPGVELVAIAEGRQELAKAVARKYGVREVVAHHRELAARDDIDAVVAIMWFPLHYGVVRELMESGKHVATEKSMCVTEPAADGILDAVERTGKIYQVCYMKRFDHGVQAAKRIVDELRASGDAGPLQLVRIWCGHGDWTWHIEDHLTSAEPVPPYDTDPEPPQPRASQAEWQWVNSWLNYYSHQTNLLRCLMGEDYTVAYHDNWSGGDVVAVQTASGSRGLMEFHQFRTAGWEEGVEISFREVQVRVKLPAPLARQQAAEVEVVYAGGPPRTERPYIEPVWAMGRQAQAFVAAVRGEAPTVSPASEAAKDVRLAWQLVKTANVG